LSLQLLDIAFLIASFAVIIAGCELFVNGIEALGVRLKLSQGVVGSVFAVMGTAMPESSIPIVAILVAWLSGEESMEVAHEIGIGAILGAPFLLVTAAMCVGGIGVLLGVAKKRRSIKLELDEKAIGLNLRFFFLVYALALVPALLRLGVLKWAIVAILVGCYAYYVKLTTQVGGEVAEPEEPPYFCRWLKKEHEWPLKLILPQVILGVSMIFGGARLFVYSMEHISLALGVSAAILSFVIAPLAKELPEQYVSASWYLRKRDTLAMCNVTGAMVFQSSLLPALGIAATPWILEMSMVGSILICIILAALLYALLKMKRINGYVLVCLGVVYVAYIGYIVSTTF